MNTITQIKLSKDDFLVNFDNSSLKLSYKNKPDKYLVDISHLNLINAVKIAILCSTYCFIKNFKKKICWIVKDEETLRAISILRLRNIEQIIQDNQKERKILAS